MSQSIRFDNSQCVTQDLQQTYDQICKSQGASDQAQCVMKLTEFCKQNVHTVEDFTNSTKLMQCYMKNNCQGNAECMRKCT